MKKNPTPEDIAKQLVNVQPMPNDCLKGIYEISKSKEELDAEGYKPVSNLDLMWTKCEDSDDC